MLIDNGHTLINGDFVSKADIQAGLFSYTPNQGAGELGSPYASFQFEVQDNGGTAQVGAFTGVDVSGNSTFTFNVIPRPTHPDGADKTQTTFEDQSRTLSNAANNDFGFSDPADGNNFAGIWITAIPDPVTQGTLVDNGHTIVAGDLVSQSSNTSISPNTFSGYFVSAARIAGNQLVFVPAANRNNAAAAPVVSFRVMDDGNIGTGAGGDNVDTADNTFSIRVTPVNERPSAPARRSRCRKTRPTPSASCGQHGLRLHRPDDTGAGQGSPVHPAGTGDNLQNVIITSLPANGTLLLGGSSVNIGDPIPPIRSTR